MEKRRERFSRQLAQDENGDPVDHGAFHKLRPRGRRKSFSQVFKRKIATVYAAIEGCRQNTVIGALIFIHFGDTA
jgi:hypothetical protein